jgi:membrane-bound ClpP family serine protease
MTVALIAFVLLLGIVLIFLEIFVIPGTTIFGVMGTAAVIASIFFAYKLLGTNYGHLSIVGGFIVFMVFFYAGRKLMDDNQMSLKRELTGKVNEFVANVKVGDVGKTFSDVKPNGKAFFGDEKLEVFSNGSYIDREIDVKIIKIEQNKIIVKPLN